MRWHRRGAQTGSQEELAPAPAQGNGAPPPALAEDQTPVKAEDQAPAKPEVQEAREWIRQWRARCEAYILILDICERVWQWCAMCTICTSACASLHMSLKRDEYKCMCVWHLCR